MKYDAGFQAFSLLSDFLEEFLNESVPKKQLDLIHKHAELIAKELTKNQYVYTPRFDDQGNYINQEDRKVRIEPDDTLVRCKQIVENYVGYGMCDCVHEILEEIDKEFTE